MNILRNLEFNVKKMNEIDSDGFMTIEGVAAIADKPLEYIDWWTGEITKEVIPIEELELSSKHIVGVPITNSHPWEFVNSRNAKDYAKGMVIESLGIEDNQLVIKAKILDADLIIDIQSGKDKLSTGYYCDMEKIAGFTANNESYTHIQRNIRYNHLAIVNDARAGEEAKITKFNSNDSNLAYSTGLNLKKQNSKGVEQMAVWKINGKDMTEQEIYAEAIRLNGENATLSTTNGTLTAENGKLQGELAVEKQNSVDLQAKINGMDTEIEERVNSRITLIGVVKENGVDIPGIEKMNELDIKKAVIKQNSTIDIEGKDVNFIEGVYLATIKTNSKDPIQTIVKNEQKENAKDDLASTWLNARKGGNK